MVLGFPEATRTWGKRCPGGQPDSRLGNFRFRLESAARLFKRGGMCVPLTHLPHPPRHKVRSVILDMEKQIKLKLGEELGSKLGLWSKLPYTVLGIMGERFGHTEASCKQRAVAVLAEFDGIVRSAGAAKVHRVLLRLLAEGSPYRLDLEAWLASSCPITDFPVLHNELLQYCMLPVVGRIIESEHARIQRNLKGREARLPGSVNAALRSAEVDALLDDPIFLGWAEAWWSKKSAGKGILSFKYTPPELARMTMATLCKKIYLYDDDEQYKDTTVERAALQLWQKEAEPMMRMPDAPMSQCMSLLLALLKDHFGSSRIFSMPAGLFRRGLPPDAGDSTSDPLAVVEGIGHDVVELRQAVAECISEVDESPAMGEEIVFFEVIAGQNTQKA